VIVEGVGAGRRELTHLLDAVVWLQSDSVEAERRVILRDAADASAIEDRQAWMAEEIPFLAVDRPWERANVIVAGTTNITHDPVGEVVIAEPCRRGEDASASRAPGRNSELTDDVAGRHRAGGRPSASR